MDGVSNKWSRLRSLLQYSAVCQGMENVIKVVQVL